MWNNLWRHIRDRPQPRSQGPLSSSLEDRPMPHSSLIVRPIFSTLHNLCGLSEAKFQPDDVKYMFYGALNFDLFGINF